MWNENYEQALAGKYEWLQLVYDSTTVDQLEQIKKVLEENAKLESSTDPTEHWIGYLAKVNLNICINKISKLKSDENAVL